MRSTATHFFFYKHILGNFHLCSFVMNDITFSNSEQAFMWLKAKHFKDPEYADKIVETTDPMSAKHLGRMVRNYDEADWDSVRMDMMFCACYAKFSQNPYLADILFETKDLILVEASPTDRVWGVGLRETDDLIIDPKNWKGRNLLGEVLMDVRQQLKEGKE